MVTNIVKLKFVKRFKDQIIYVRIYAAAEVIELLKPYFYSSHNIPLIHKNYVFTSWQWYYRRTHFSWLMILISKLLRLINSFSESDLKTSPGNTEILLKHYRTFFIHMHRLRNVYLKKTICKTNCISELNLNLLSFIFIYS